MKKFLTTLAQKWPEYLLEILVLIIGIYGAFMLDNWNETRKETIQEIKYLQNLQIDLNADIVNLDSMIADRRRKTRSALKLLELQPPTTEEGIKDYYRMIWGVFGWTSFTPRTNTMDELISTGNLSILSDDSIKHTLLRIKQMNDELIPRRLHMRREYEEYLYDRSMSIQPVVAGIDINSLLLDDVSKNVPILDDELRQLSIQIKTLLEDLEIRNGLILAASNNTGLVEFYLQMKADRQKLVNMIDVKLDN